MGNTAISRLIPQKLQLSVMMMDGKVLAVEVWSTNTVGHVKTKISDKLGVRQSRQRLVFDGKVMQDGRTLAHYSVGRESTRLQLAICSSRRRMQIFL
jgi:ubiquitin C